VGVKRVKKKKANPHHLSNQKKKTKEEEKMGEDFGEGQSGGFFDTNLEIEKWWAVGGGEKQKSKRKARRGSWGQLERSSVGGEKALKKGKKRKRFCF